MKKLWKWVIVGLLVCTAAYAAEINSLSTTDASNTARFPEGMAPSAVNNAARALEGLIARWFKDQNGSLSTGGSANTYTLSANQTLSAYYDGLKLSFKVTPTNTGASTLNVDSVGAASIVKYGSTELASGDLTQGDKVTVIYDGTSFQVVSPLRKPANVTGSDTGIVSGTAGTNGNLAQWNGDGDLVDGPDVLDEDDMASDSASAVPTQQSTKAYVDTHTGVAKAWAKITWSGGTPSIQASYNVDSIVDDSTGTITINWDTDFSDANYSVLATVLQSSGPRGAIVTSQAAGSVQIAIFTTTTGATVDPNGLFVSAYGSQ